MTVYKNLKEGLQEAIYDYNRWIGKSAGYDPVKGYGELRGIFFNKLMTRLRDTDGFFAKNRAYYGRLLQPADFLCELGRSCSLDKLLINPPIASEAPYRKDVLLELRELAPIMVYDLVMASTETDISVIVNEIKAYKL